MKYDHLFADSRFVVDQDVLDALGLYVVLGLDPGSFGRALLIGDYRQALSKAHELLRRSYEGQDPVANMLAFTATSVPAECRGSAEAVKTWIERGGMGTTRADTGFDIAAFEAATGTPLSGAWFWAAVPARMRGRAA